MKRLAIALITLFLLAHGAFAQIIPEAPSAPSDPAWNQLRTIAIGQPIVITTTDNRSVHCLFGSVTDTYLFCNPPGNAEGVGFRFDRIDVLSVDFDRSGFGKTQARKAERNYHPAWISSMIAGGLVAGIIASQNTDAGHAAQDGLIGAAVVGAIGAPLALLPHPDCPPLCAGPVCGRYPIALRLRPHSMGHRRSIHLR
jgi:hypothetical protein